MTTKTNLNASLSPYNRPGYQLITRDPELISLFRLAVQGKQSACIRHNFILRDEPHRFAKIVPPICFCRQCHHEDVLRRFGQEQ